MLSSGVMERLFLIMLNNIEESKTSLRKSERLVADYVLAHPNRVISMNLSDLARIAGVSQPTIIRFCKAIGFSGFRQFKLNLAQNLANELRYFHPGLQANAARESEEDRFVRVARLLGRTREHVSSRALCQASSVLRRARRIECLAVGAAGACALDAQRLLLRKGKPSGVWNQARQLIAAARLLSSEDAVLIIVTDPREQRLIHAAQAVLQSEAKLVAIAPAKAPLCELAHSALTLEVDTVPELERRIVATVVLATLIDHLAQSDVMC